MRNETRFLVLLSILVLTACSGSGDSAGDLTQQSSAMALSSETVEAYVKVQQALAADDFEGAQTALNGLAERSQGEIRDLAVKARDAEDIASVRDIFVHLSEKLLAGLPELDQYKVAFCPMANGGLGAHWVQEAGEIRNPYYGADMLTCGRFGK